jgi:hypothetical protein
LATTVVRGGDADVAFEGAAERGFRAVADALGYLGQAGLAVAQE